MQHNYAIYNISAWLGCDTYEFTDVVGFPTIKKQVVV